jgi:hypothetical protein
MVKRSNFAKNKPGVRCTVQNSFSGFKKLFHKAILPTPCCRRYEESIYEYKYLREFEAKNAKASTHVLGIFANPINTENFKNLSRARQFL